MSASRAAARTIVSMPCNGMKLPWNRTRPRRWRVGVGGGPEAVGVGARPDHQRLVGPQPEALGVERADLGRVDDHEVRERERRAGRRSPAGAPSATPRPPWRGPTRRCRAARAAGRTPPVRGAASTAARGGACRRGPGRGSPRRPGAVWSAPAASGARTRPPRATRGRARSPPTAENRSVPQTSRRSTRGSHPAAASRASSIRFRVWTGSNVPCTSARRRRCSVAVNGRRLQVAPRRQVERRPGVPGRATTNCRPRWCTQADRRVGCRRSP